MISKPSRITAKRAIATRASADLSVSAASACPSSTCFSSREWPRIPDDHVGDRSHGDQGDGGFEALLLLRQVVAHEVEHDADDGADRDGRSDAEPHPPQRVAPVLGEKRAHDPHDQGRFEALAEPDDEGGDHVRSTLQRMSGTAAEGSRLVP